ncbi:hypothetical protein ALDI51_37570 [Alicycliphilus denitrificans]|nr:hypothetical protein ALDI51_37570 [Alicycliphilus denitrificans]
MEAGKRMGATVPSNPAADKDSPRRDAGFRDRKKKTRSACGFATRPDEGQRKRDSGTTCRSPWSELT